MKLWIVLFAGAPRRHRASGPFSTSDAAFEWADLNGLEEYTVQQLDDPSAGA